MLGRAWRRIIQWQRALWLIALGVGLTAYFGYHAVNGSRGLLAWREVSTQLAATRAEFEALRAERLALAAKVGGLRHDALDADLIDEVARRQLSLVDPLDVIILLDDDDESR